MDDINDQRRRRLKKYCPEFVDTIDPVVILPYFEKMHQSTKEKILCITRNDGNVRGALELHSLMPKADSDWFEYLMKALKKAGYTELLKKLQDDDDDTNHKKVTGYKRTTGTHSTDHHVSSPHQEMSEGTNTSSIAAFGTISNTNGPPSDQTCSPTLCTDVTQFRDAPSVPQNTPDKIASSCSSHHHGLPDVQDSQLAASSNTQISASSNTQISASSNTQNSASSNKQHSASSNTQNYKHQISNQHNYKHITQQNVPSPDTNTHCEPLSTKSVPLSTSSTTTSTPRVHSQHDYRYTPDNADAGPFQQSCEYQSKPNHRNGDRHNSHVINVNDLTLGQVKQGVREAFNRRLDHQTYPSNNWKSLADKLGLTVDEVDDIGSASQLYEKLKTSGMKLVELVEYLKAMKRLDLISEIQPYHVVGDLASLDQQTSDIMWSAKVERSTSVGTGVSEVVEESAEINSDDTNHSSSDNSKQSVNTNTLARNISEHTTSAASDNPNKTSSVPFSNSDNITLSVRKSSDPTKLGATGNLHKVNKGNASAGNKNNFDSSTSNPIKNDPVEHSLDLKPPDRKYSVGNDAEPFVLSSLPLPLQSDNQPPYESRIEVSASYTLASAQEQETLNKRVQEQAEVQEEERDLLDSAEKPDQFQNLGAICEESSVDSPTPQGGNSTVQYIKEFAGAIFEAFTNV